jgi:hypothetical protein
LVETDIAASVFSQFEPLADAMSVSAYSLAASRNREMSKEIIRERSRVWAKAVIYPLTLLASSCNTSLPEQR